MTDNTTIDIQRFETRRQVVEAAQLTADADWQAIAEWCGGEVCECGKEVYVPGACFDPGDGDWVIRIDADTFTAETEGEFPKGFQPVPGLEGVVGEIRQTLEDTTPGPWEWEEQYDGFLVTEGRSTYVIEISAYGDEIIADRHDRALIAAAPDLLARAADRIEQLEAIVTEIGRSFDGVDGLCQVCGSWVDRGFNYANKHADSCEVLAAINIAKGGA